MENEPGAAPEVPTRGQRLPGVLAAGEVEARAAPPSTLNFFSCLLQGGNRPAPKGNPRRSVRNGRALLYCNNTTPTFNIPAAQARRAWHGSFGCDLAVFTCLCGALGCEALGS